MTNDEKLEKIGKLMRTILMCPNGDTYKPIKGTTKSDCYRVLGEIQRLLGTDIAGVGDDDCLRVLVESKARQVYADSTSRAGSSPATGTRPTAGNVS